jgi:hypothetical protein
MSQSAAVQAASVSGRVVDGKTTRDPSEEESRAITFYVEAYRSKFNSLPMGIHDVPGVGEVWYIMNLQ